MRVPLAVLGELIGRPHWGHAPAAAGLASLSTLRLTLIRPVTPSTSERRSSSSSPWRRPTNAASTMRSLRWSGIASVMTSISSRVAGTAIRWTRAVLAPRIFGGARSMSSSSSAATSIERSSR